MALCALSDVKNLLSSGWWNCVLYLDLTFLFIHGFTLFAMLGVPDSGR